MHITKLRLRAFRNFADGGICPSPGFNLIVGPNAQGKTNLIEAIYLMASGRSFRGATFSEMMMWERGACEISALAQGDGRDDELKFRMDKNGRAFLKNEKRMSPGKGSALTAVVFAPEEILLLKGPPSERRWYFDALISQLDPQHGSSARKYARALSHKNKLLKDDGSPMRRREAEIAAWNEGLAALGAKVVEGRRRWCEALNAHLPKGYSAVAPADGEAAFMYRPHCGDELAAKGSDEIRLGLLKEMSRRAWDEMTRRIALVGPHRDDFESMLGPVSLRSFGSQGQMRTFSLALKVAEIGLFLELTGEPPVLLLDDVASELDGERNRAFFDFVMGLHGQVFATATADADLKLSAGARLSVFDVRAGCATPRE